MCTYLPSADVLFQFILCPALLFSINSILCTISGPTLFPTLSILQTASTLLARYNLTSMSSKPGLTTNLRRIKTRLLQRLPIHLLCDHSLLTHTNNYTSSVHIHKLHFMATVEATFHLNMWPFINNWITFHETTIHPTFHTLPFHKWPAPQLPFINDVSNNYIHQTTFHPAFHLISNIYFFFVLIEFSKLQL